MTDNELRGRTALVTGAAKRIGHEIAVALADEGVNIVIHYRSSAEEAAGLRSELDERGVQSWPVKADFEEPQQYADLVPHALKIAGSLDIIINSASVFPPSTLDDIEFKHLTRNMQVNAWVPFVLSRDFAKLVGKGKVINILDTRIKRGYDRWHVAYILSKHVLAVLTRMMAIEFAPDITVNAVAPGLILPPPGENMGYLERLAHTVPLKRHGDPSDVAEAVLYLLKSQFVTGEVIHVDGGRHLVECTDGPHHNQ